MISIQINEANESIKEDIREEMRKRIELCNENSMRLNPKLPWAHAKITFDMIDQKDVDLVVMAKRRKLKGVKKLLSEVYQKRLSKMYIVL